jgi:micrococcal nuclease
VEYYGKEASTFTRNLLQGESVYLVYGQERIDRYGRTLGYLYRAPDGLFANAEIIRQGYGHAYTRFPFRHMELFKDCERLAQESGKGLWAQ